MITNGYSLTLNKIQEADIKSTTISNNNENVDIDMSNPEKAKQDLQQNIKDVEEIQNLKDELDDKMDNLLEEDKSIEDFPSTDFTDEPILYQDLNIETFNDELTAEQKAYINTYIGTLEEFCDAMCILYDEVGDGVAPIISINEYIKEILADGGIKNWEEEMSNMLGYDIKNEEKEKLVELSQEDLEKLANDIIDWYGSDMGVWFDEIQGNEEEIWQETMGYLENRDQEQIQHVIDDVEEADLDDKTAKEINVATTSSLLNRLKSLLNTEVKTESKSKFYTADKMFDDFLKTAEEEADENGYTFKLSDLGLTKEDSAEFKNLLLQRDEIEDVSYDPQNNTYTVKVTDVGSEGNKDSEE